MGHGIPGSVRYPAIESPYGRRRVTAESISARTDTPAPAETLEAPKSNRPGPLTSPDALLGLSGVGAVDECRGGGHYPVEFAFADRQVGRGFVKARVGAEKPGSRDIFTFSGSYGDPGAVRDL